MKKTIASYTEVNEGGLNAGFDIDNLTFVNIANPVVLTGPFRVQLFKNSVLQQCDSAFLHLGDIDEHFLFHRLRWFLSMVAIEPAETLRWIIHEQ